MLGFTVVCGGFQMGCFTFTSNDTRGGSGVSFRGSLGHGEVEGPLVVAVLFDTGLGTEGAWDGGF